MMVYFHTGLRALNGTEFLKEKESKGLEFYWTLGAGTL